MSDEDQLATFMKEVMSLKQKQAEILNKPFIQLLPHGIKVKKGGFRNRQVVLVLRDLDEVEKGLKAKLDELATRWPAQYADIKLILQDVNQGLRVFCLECRHVSWRCPRCPHCGASLTPSKP